MTPILCGTMVIPSKKKPGQGFVECWKDVYRIEKRIWGIEGALPPLYFNDFSVSPHLDLSAAALKAALAALDN